jgi:hypothetical protein
VPLCQHEELSLKIAMVFPGMIYYPDRIDQYFGGYSFTHGDTNARQRLKGRELGGIFRVSQRLDGFTSLDFAYSGGSLLTHPFTFAGGQLQLNINTSAAGEGRVAILDQEGKAIEGLGLEDCRVVNGDFLNKIVEWRKGTNVAPLAGKTVRLRLELRGAKLFAFQFTG